MTPRCRVPAECSCRQSAVRTQAGPDVRTHLPPLGARQNHRSTASTVFGAHRGSGHHRRRPIPVVPRGGTLRDALPALARLERAGRVGSGAGASSAFPVLARVEPARGLAGDPVPVNRHPPFEPGVTGIVLNGYARWLKSPRRVGAAPARCATLAQPLSVSGLSVLSTLKEQRSEKYRQGLIGVVSIGVRAGQLGWTDAWLSSHLVSHA